MHFLFWSLLSGFVLVGLAPVRVLCHIWVHVLVEGVVPKAGVIRSVLVVHDVLAWLLKSASLLPGD